MKSFQRKNKAQTATEYLIILAVVIIIALIVVGVLGGIPGIGGSSRSSAADAFWQTSEIGIPAYAFGEVGQDSITVKNNRAAAIIVEDVRVHPTLSSVSTVDTSTLFNNTANASLSNQTLAAGQTYKYENGTTPSGYVNVIWSHLNCNTGETYSFYVEIDWKDVPTGARFTFDGGDTTIEGVCAR